MSLRGMTAFAPIRFLSLLCLALVSTSCGEAPRQAEKSGPVRSETAGFEAVITGAYEGKVSGSGVLNWLPQAGFERKGAYFLADGQGVRPHGVTFTLPRNIAPGKHGLQNPSPFEAGTVPSVRVDRDMGNATVSAGRNTSGFLNLIAFPADPNGSNGAEVKGDFEFETEDREGRKIKVTGRFAFKAE